MRILLSLSILAIITACFDPDFTKKKCENQDGCPPTFNCVVGRCAPAQPCSSQDRSCESGLVCNVGVGRCEPPPDMAAMPTDM